MIKTPAASDFIGKCKVDKPIIPTQKKEGQSRS